MNCWIPNESEWQFDRQPRYCSQDPQKTCGKGKPLTRRTTAPGVSEATPDEARRCTKRAPLSTVATPDLQKTANLYCSPVRASHRAILRSGPPSLYSWRRTEAHVRCPLGRASDVSCDSQVRGMCKSDDTSTRLAIVEWRHAAVWTRAIAAMCPQELLRVLGDYLFDCTHETGGGLFDIKLSVSLAR
jgi:hypothetical protein